jgi:alpha/beta superfamily hydrolase
MKDRAVIFSHGKDSEPWGAKITAMAEAARALGFSVDSMDYRGLDDPRARERKLLDYCRGHSGPKVLVGSSLGGHVSAAVSQEVQPIGMFLLAPAFYMPGYEQHTPVPSACPISIVHGWRDDVVPVQNSIRFASDYRSRLHVLDSDHRLTNSLAEIVEYFRQFLAQQLGQADR